MAMTDKQMSEKKNEYYEKFVGYDAYGELTDAENEKLLIWQWIEKLVEEVEREKSEEIEELKHWLKRYEKDISNAIN